ncbi:hypothetical protein KCP78_06230 [Salmonella enterica subsp. enterica]|nr:hypothetical protein KCP78_06230 [Salmonella enterica subsp. enterica]
MIRVITTLLPAAKTAARLWVPMALAAAIARVLITEDIIDKPFLDKYCIGYDGKPLCRLGAATRAIKPIFWVRARR